MSRARSVVLTAIATLVSGAAGYGLHEWAAGGATSASRSPEPRADALFKARLADLDGGVQSLEQWRGRVLVVNFWATWCAPCREEIPEFIRMQDRFGRQGLQFVGIAIDQPDKVARFVREFSINYPVLLGGVEAMDLMRQAGNRVGVLPFTLVFDRKGTVVSGGPGGLREERLESLIRPLL